MKEKVIEKYEGHARFAFICEFSSGYDAIIEGVSHAYDTLEEAREYMNEEGYTLVDLHS